MTEVDIAAEFLSSIRKKNIQRIRMGVLALVFTFILVFLGHSLIVSPFTMQLSDSLPNLLLILSSGLVFLGIILLCSIRRPLRLRWLNLDKLIEVSAPVLFLSFMGLLDVLLRPRLMNFSMFNPAVFLAGAALRYPRQTRIPVFFLPWLGSVTASYFILGDAQIELRFLMTADFTLASGIGFLACTLFFKHSEKLFFQHNAMESQQIQLTRMNQELNTAMERLTRTTEEFRKLSVKDYLTGTANRAGLDEYLSREWRRCQRESIPLGILMLDIDHFKLFNDIHGHLQGDEGLILVARAIQEALLRPTDLVARWGGEEFMVVLPGEDQAGILTVAERIRRAVWDLGLPHSGSKYQRLTISIGAASSIPKHTRTIQAIIRDADQALYQAKQSSRNRVVAAGGLSKPNPGRPPETQGSA